MRTKVTTMKPMDNWKDNFGGYDDEEEESPESWDNSSLEKFIHFAKKRMTDEELEVIKSQDIKVIGDFCKVLRAGGEIPADWPDLKMRVLDTGDCVGCDMPSLVFMVCLYHSPPKSNGRGYKLMPDSVKDIQDWIWTPTADLSFVYVPTIMGLKVCVKDKLETSQALRKALSEVTLAPLRAIADIPEEINLADVLVCEARAVHELTSEDECHKIESRIVELLGVTAKESRIISVEARRSAWIYLLSLSPRYQMVRTVVQHAEAGEPGQIFFTKLIASVDEILQENFVRNTALSAGKDEIKAPGTSVVVITEGDDAFEFYKNHQVWDHMAYKGINVSPNAENRLKEWEDQVTASFKTPPLA